MWYRVRYPAFSPKACSPYCCECWQRSGALTNDLEQSCFVPDLRQRLSLVGRNVLPKVGQTNRTLEDVPMSRVKFNVNTEYAYLQNFKILQSKCCRLYLDPTNRFSSQAVLPNTTSTASFPSKRSLNARCRITSSFCSGPRDSGTNISLEVNTTQ